MDDCESQWKPSKNTFLWSQHALWTIVHLRSVVLHRASDCGLPECQIPEVDASKWFLHVVITTQIRMHHYMVGNTGKDDKCIVHIYAPLNVLC